MQIDSGFDKDENGQLSQDEISVSKIVCNGTNGMNSLVRIYDEPSGSNCIDGGKRIVTGLDLDGDELLSSSEIQDTQYVCNIDGVANDGSSCSVTDNLDGTATISCEDGTTADLEGNDGSLNYIIICYSNLDGSFSDVFWDYTVFVMANDDVYVKAGISDSEVTVSNFAIYSSEDVDYDTAPIFVHFDTYLSANGGYWKLEFDDVNFGVNVDYYDPSITKSWASDASDCSSIDYTTP